MEVAIIKGMLARIFSDAVAEDSERKELGDYLASGALSALSRVLVTDPAGSR